MNSPPGKAFSVDRDTSNSHPDLAETASRFKQISWEIVIVDLDLAHTFMEVARTSSNDEVIRRNYKNARNAYDFVVRSLEKLNIDEREHQSVQDKLNLLRKRLKQAGQEFENYPHDDA